MPNAVERQKSESFSIGRKNAAGTQRRLNIEQAKQRRFNVESALCALSDGFSMHSKFIVNIADIVNISN